MLLCIGSPAPLSTFQHSFIDIHVVLGAMLEKGCAAPNDNGPAARELREEGEGFPQDVLRAEL